MKLSLPLLPQFLPFAILILALLLRLPLLNGSFWLDEAAQALESVRPLSQQLDIAADFQPPLYHLWLHLFTYFGTAEWWLRLASLIPGIVTIYFTIKIANQFTSTKRALLAGLLLATSQFHLFYSQELRPYMFATMWATIATYYFFIWLYQSKSNLNYWYLCASILGWYSTYLFPLIHLPHLVIAALYHRAKIIPLLKHLAIILLAFIPWLSSFFNQLKIGLALTQNLPGWSEVVSLPLFKSLPLTLAKLLIGRIPFNLEPQPIFLSLLILIPFAYFGYKALKNISYSYISMLLIVVPLTAAFFISIFVPVLEPKRLLFLLPFMYLLVTIHLTFNRLELSLIAMLLTGNLLAVGMYFDIPDLQREPWREAVVQIEFLAPRHSAIVFAFNAPFAPWHWYQSQELTTYSLPANRPVDPQALNQLAPALNHPDLFLFEYLMDLTDPDRQIISWLQQNGFSEVGFIQQPGIGKIYHFQKLPLFAQSTL
jgi:uncharacterized membrane protein